MRLIDADALELAFIEKGQASKRYKIGEFWELNRNEIWDALDGVPSAQPEVIRCKDCKYWDTSWQKDDAPNYHYCPMLDGIREGDFYCADAERRTDG